MKPATDTRSLGFNLVETALVLLLIGFLLSLGTASWSTLAASRRMAQTRAELFQVKQCLVRHAAAGGRYPTYLSTIDCTQEQETDLGVCLCRTGPRDVWGNAFLFLEGRDESGAGLAGKSITDDAYQNLEAVIADSGSAAVDSAGHSHTSVAFVLVSLGPNGTADGTFDAFSAGTAARTMRKTADFSTGGEDYDDLYLIVSSRELRAVLRE